MLMRSARVWVITTGSAVVKSGSTRSSISKVGTERAARWRSKNSPETVTLPIPVSTTPWVATPSMVTGTMMRLASHSTQPVVKQVSDPPSTSIGTTTGGSTS